VNLAEQAANDDPKEEREPFLPFIMSDTHCHNLIHAMRDQWAAAPTMVAGLCAEFP